MVLHAARRWAARGEAVDVVEVVADEEQRVVDEVEAGVVGRRRWRRTVWQQWRTRRWLRRRQWRRRRWRRMVRRWREWDEDVDAVAVEAARVVEVRGVRA